MSITDEEFNLFQTIHKTSSLDFPCPSNVVEAAAGLIEAGHVAIRGLVEKNGAADLYVTDAGKWKLIGAGRVLRT